MRISGQNSCPSECECCDIYTQSCTKCEESSQNCEEVDGEGLLVEEDVGEYISNNEVDITEITVDLDQYYNYFTVEAKVYFLNQSIRKPTIISLNSQPIITLKPSSQIDTIKISENILLS